MKNKVILPLIMVRMLSGVGSAMMTVASGVNPARIGSFMAARSLPSASPSAPSEPLSTPCSSGR